MPLKSQNKFESIGADGTTERLKPLPLVLTHCLRGDSAKETPRMTKLTKRTIDATEIKSSDYVC